MAEPIILIADGNAEESNRLAGILRERGHRVHRTFRGIQVLTQIRTHPPALLLMAVHLADMSGFEVCRRLKRQERSRTIPILFITGDVDEQAEGFSLGACDYIPSPLRAAEVLARVQAHLELGRMRTGSAFPDADLDEWDASPLEEAKGEEWVRLAMQAGQMYRFVWDAQTDEVQRSGECSKILGIRFEATRDTGQSFFGMVHPDDVKGFEGILSILSPAFDAYSTQYRFRRPNGEIAVLRENARGYFDASGRLTRISGIVVDVTEQTAARRELEQSQANLLQLIERLPLAAAVADSQGWIKYINEGFTRTFGYRLDEISEPHAWWERAYPDEGYRREVIAAWGRTIARDLRQGETIPAREYQITDKEGMEHSVDVFGTMIGNCNLILFDDNSDRKRSEGALRESEERFRGMADTAPVMLWVSGPDKLCSFFNKGWLAFTGRTMEQELGNGWANGVHPDDLDRCLAIYAAAFDAREDFQMEYRLRRADGEYRWVVDHGTPRFSADGTFAGYVGSAVDITDSKLNQERMLLAQKLESLGLLAGGVVHDFGNYLGSILADADTTLAELGANSLARPSLQRIEAVALQASDMVRQIMSYTSQEKRGLEPVDVSSLVQDMLKLLRLCIPKQAKVSVDLPPSLFLPQANAAQIRQVIMNLVLNAGEAIGNQRGTITITGKRENTGGNRLCASAGTPPDAGCIRLEISDTGIGMTEEIRGRIFDPFFTTKSAGRGLGLAAVQEIVRSHGGSIEVESTLGHGARFRILLPCDHKQKGHPPTPEGVAASVPSGSILIVEDEEALRVSVAKMLRRRGFSVLEACDGDFAVELIRERNEDIAVVLLDLTLPGKSAREVLEELRRKRPAAKVIITSAYGCEMFGGPVSAFNLETFIRKPYHISELVTAVSQALPPDKREAVLARQSGGAK
jgi:PAS domain S-box-containing protein